ncbi:MAG TPA: MFS transporter [Propionibacteriaceae bacterium]|jgi:predicted MFS family arabinose efflux permease
MTLSTADVAAGERLLTAAFIRLTLADVAYFTATGVAIYTLPLWVTGPIGSDKSGAGLAFGAFAVSALILRPVAGRLADTRGRRPLLVGGALISAVGMLGTAYADNLVLVILLRLLLGVAEAAFFVASIATLADLAPPSRMGEATSYNSLGLYLGLAFGPPLAEMLVRTAGFSAAWYGAAALSLIAAVAAAGIKNLRSGVATGGRIRLIYWKAVPPALGFFASVVAMGALFAFGALQANAVGLMPASTPLFVYGLVVVAGRLSLARFLDRLPALMLGAAALVIIAGGLMIMAFWSTPLGMALGAAVFALGVTLSTPAFFSAIFATAQPSERGAASGTASVFLDLAMGGGPMLLGLAAQAGGIPFAFGLAAAVALAGSGWILALSRHAQHAAR